MLLKAGNKKGVGRERNDQALNARDCRIYRRMQILSHPITAARPRSTTNRKRARRRKTPHPYRIHPIHLQLLPYFSSLMRAILHMIGKVQKKGPSSSLNISKKEED